MFDWKTYEKHKSIFSQVGEGLYHSNMGQHHIHMRPTQILSWMEFCRDELEYLTLLDIAGLSHPKKSSRWEHSTELVYLLFSMENHQRLSLHVHFDDGEVLPSVCDYFPHAVWMEREQAEMLGIKFDVERDNLLLPHSSASMEKPTVLPKLRINPNKSEPPYPEEKFIWKRFGIYDSMSAGHFEWQVCFDPLKVVDSRTKIGFHHRSFEKKLEDKTWLHVMQIADLINLGAAPTYSTAWAKNLEDILRVKLPERAQAIRIVLLELARISEHLTVLHQIAFALKMDEHRFFLNAREKVHELLEKYSGHRQGTGVIRLGGVREDLPHGWVIEFQTLSTILSKGLLDLHRALLGQKNFKSSLENSIVSAQTVLQWGISGPAMRASGLNFDLRKSQPLYFYQDIDFDIPVGIHGTAFDRYLIRYEEIHQSVRIITQVLDNLPLGEVLNPLFAQDEISLADKLEEVPTGWHYSGLESPNGEAGFLHCYSGRVNPLRLKIKTPSFMISQALKHFVQGSEEGQLPANLASLGISKTEQDR